MLGNPILARRAQESYEARLEIKRASMARALDFASPDRELLSYDTLGGFFITEVKMIRTQCC